MKKNIHIFIFSILFFCFLFISCANKNTSKNRETHIDLSKTDFVYLKNNEFKLRNEKFFPLILNYRIVFRNINDTIVISPAIEYENLKNYENNTKDSTHNQIMSHFHLIKDMGFNTVRLTFDKILYDDGYTHVNIENQTPQIISELNNIIKLAESNELRVILLLKEPLNKILENYTKEILKLFKDNPTIFAYDFFNEPVYFDEVKNRDKKEAKKIVERWKSWMRQYAPNQLFTISFSEPIEVFKWDPSILPVDFIEVHTYNPMRVKSEIYWYSKYINKPWIIGETSLPADNDSISYEEQRQFAKEVLEYAVDCGAIGLGWWDFQDYVKGDFFEHNFTGIMNHIDTTYTSDGKYRIFGTIKPAIEEIRKIKNYVSKNKKNIPVNYYNMLGYNNFVIKGKIIDKATRKGIEGAVIRGWDENWAISWHSYTNGKGEFSLYSNIEYKNFEVSAPGMTKIFLDESLKYKKITNENYDIHNLPDEKLEYQKISYKNYLIRNPKSPFDFDKSKFDKAKFEGKMEVIELKKIDF